jgi:hypothetical protein
MLMRTYSYRIAVVAVTAITSCLVLAACATPPQKSERPATVSETSSAAANVQRQMVTETVEVPFAQVTRDDPSLASGKRVVSVTGVPGTKTVTYEVTLTNGVQTDRRLVSEVVTKEPIAEVTLVGTKPKPVSNCDPNYSGACVPIASDVDCEGGGGNGPAYVRGPVYVIGTDIYGLDADHDGIGCE